MPEVYIVLNCFATKKIAKKKILKNTKRLKIQTNNKSVDKVQKPKVHYISIDGIKAFSILY